jgi:hypothetical protein
MLETKGRYLSLSWPRRYMNDGMYFARQMPHVSVLRQMNLRELAAARQTACPRPGWCSLFVRAFGLVAARRPELRRLYMSYPWPHLYEHPHTVALVPIDRPHDDENAVYVGNVRSPESQDAVQIDGHLRRYQNEPLDRISLFRRARKVSAQPLFLRRLLWWWALNASGAGRAKYFGTCVVSSVAAMGAELQSLIIPATIGLTYGIVAKDGTVNVRMLFDHRVLDGALVARALEDLERVLRTDLVVELRYQCAFDAA